jgi:hypothetical protein
MPRRRQVTKPAHRQLTWDETFISEQLDFICGWSPPATESDRGWSTWRSWPEFLQDWSLVRADALSDAREKHFGRDDEPGEPFAEFVYQATLVGKDPEVAAAEWSAARHHEYVRELGALLGRNIEDL